MRPTRFQLSVRRLMLAVAVIALILSLFAYRQRLRRTAEEHEVLAIREAEPISAVGTGAPGTLHLNTSEGRIAYRLTPQSQGHQDEARGYDDAAMRVDLLIITLLFLILLFGVGRVLWRRGTRTSRPQPVPLLDDSGVHPRTTNNQGRRR